MGGEEAVRVGLKILCPTNEKRVKQKARDSKVKIIPTQASNEQHSLKQMNDHKSGGGGKCQGQL